MEALSRITLNPDIAQSQTNEALIDMNLSPSWIVVFEKKGIDGYVAKTLLQSILKTV